MKLSTLSLLAILTAFGFGLIGLFAISFDRGEVYPPLSSFRTDPLGSRLLYDSLGALPGRKVERNLSVNPQVENATVLFLGVGALSLVESYSKQIDEETSSGARVVVAFNPITRAGNLKPSHLKWGLIVDFGAKGAVIDAGSTARETLVYFRNLDPSWKTIQSGRWGAVAIARPLNKGSLVLCAESFPFTNEALVLNRDTALLAEAVGPSPRIIFDEFHLGVRENPGVALLMRKFRLHALLASLAIAAFLFVWSVSAPFPPIHESVAEDEAVGFAARSGMIRLLQRSIPTSKLLAACGAEWERTASTADPRTAQIRDRAANAQRDDITAAYREIQSILEQK